MYVSVATKGADRNKGLNHKISSTNRYKPLFLKDPLVAR